MISSNFFKYTTPLKKGQEMTKENKRFSDAEPALTIKPAGKPCEDLIGVQRNTASTDKRRRRYGYFENRAANSSSKPVIG
jgi:hypothetical protein